MAGFDWFRWHHGTVTDPKFALVAKKAGASLPDVLAVWAFLLEKASAATVRGVFGEIDAEAVDCLFGFAEGRTGAILAALDARKLTKAGEFCAWSARQPKRERDDNSADRVTAFRERKRQVTPSNASGDQETPRGEESREEKNLSDSLPSRTDRTIGSPATDPAPEDAVGAFEGHPPADTAKATEAGLVLVGASLRIRAAGCEDVSASSPHLIQALADGITVDELCDIAAGKGRGKGIAYLVKAARGLRADAAASAGSLPVATGSTRNHQGPSPRKSREEEKEQEREALELMRRQHEELGYGAH